MYDTYKIINNNTINVNSGYKHNSNTKKEDKAKMFNRLHAVITAFSINNHLVFSLLRVCEKYAKKCDSLLLNFALKISW